MENKAVSTLVILINLANLASSLSFGPEKVGGAAGAGGSPPPLHFASIASTACRKSTFSYEKVVGLVGFEPAKLPLSVQVYGHASL